MDEAAKRDTVFTIMRWLSVWLVIGFWLVVFGCPLEGAVRIALIFLAWDFVQLELDRPRS